MKKNQPELKMKNVRSLLYVLELECSNHISYLKIKTIEKKFITFNKE